MKREQLSPSEALTLLKNGNDRFVNGLRSVETATSASKLTELAENGQNPFAVILTCSDSRVPTELVFDRGFGDLFVVRIAGNIVMPSIIGSIEFAVSNFGTSLCVVMGHSECGAVKAAASVEFGAKMKLSPNLEAIVEKIRPSVRSVLASGGHDSAREPSKQLLQEATFRNSDRGVSEVLEQSELLRAAVSEGKLQVLSANFDLRTGRASFEPAVLGSSTLPRPGQLHRQEA